MRSFKFCWIDEFVKYFGETVKAPRDFLFWTAVSAISASLKRECWFQTRGYKLYPNQYIVLVGTPGTGKGASIQPLSNIVKNAGTANILAGRLTAPAIFERVSKGFSSVHSIGKGVSLSIDHSVYIIAAELPVLLANHHELKYFSDIWDSREVPFDYITRSGGTLVIPNPCFNLIGGVTMQGLTDAVPQLSIGSGFTKRIIFVYATHKDRPPRHEKDLWPDMKDIIVPDYFVNSIREIASTTKGSFRLEDKCKPLFAELVKRSTPGDIEEEFVSHFKTEVIGHTLKLSMSLTASLTDSMEIPIPILERAMAEVEKIISNLPRVFGTSGDSDLASLGGRILNFIEAKGYATRGEIIKSMWRHGKSEQIDALLLTFMQCMPPAIIETTMGGQQVFKIFIL